MNLVASARIRRVISSIPGNTFCSNYGTCKEALRMFLSWNDFRKSNNKKVFRKELI
jgi:hypothetical protein